MRKHVDPEPSHGSWGTEETSEATTYTKTWQTDTLFKKLELTKISFMNTVLKKQKITKTYLINVLLSNTLENITFNLDLILLKTGLKQRQINVLLKRLGISKIFTVDSALRKKIQTLKSIDSLFKKPRVLKQFGVNTEFLERNVTKSFSVDSRLGAVTTHTIQKYTDILLQKSDITKMFNADVYLKKSREAQAQINTLFLKTSTVQKNFDVSLQKTETKTLNLDVWFGTAAPTAHTKIFGVKTMFRYRIELPTPLGITLDGQLVIPLKREVWIGNQS